MRLKTTLLASLLAVAIGSLPLIAQEVVTARFKGSSTPAGTAPTIDNTVGYLNIASNGGTNINSCCFTVPDGYSVGVYMTLTPAPATFTMKLTLNGVDDITIPTVDTHTLSPDNRTIFFFQSNVTTGGASVGFHGTSSSGLSYIAGIGISLHCATTTCTQEQANSFTDTSGTGGSLLFTGGSITTAHQMNELIVGGCSYNFQSSHNPGTITAGSGYATFTHSIAQAGGGGVMIETKTVSATGSQAATMTESTSQDSVCFTTAFY